MEQTQETNFVYYLLSNASMNVYPSNKPQNFRTLLPNPLNLEGDWEVGLSTIIYPHNWNHIKAPSRFSLNHDVAKVSDNTKTIIGHNIVFPYQQFSDIDELIRLLNDSANKKIETDIAASIYKSLQPNQNLKYKHIEFVLTSTLPRKVQVKSFGFGSNYLIGLPTLDSPARELWRMLGFEDSLIQLKEGSEAKYPASLTLHFPSLYVYTPMIEYVGVGDTHAPLFAVVPIRGKLGEIVYERFEKPIYMKLNRKYISEIEISIKDDTGSDVQFGAGKTILILHFRRRT